MPVNERTGLLDDHARNFWSFGTDNRDDFHAQFCKLVGIPPSDLPPHEEPPPIGPKTLYGRALRMKRNQGSTYAITAGISNSLLLLQVILGAAVTALGASESSHILITLFGATNTIIAGIVAYLKSRGQPMRARMYRDDLERVVDEIENSEIMWLGISKRMHGYSDINTDDEVTVRSEVARLTRLFDRAVRTNSVNNPDMYMAGQGLENTNLALRKGPLPTGTVLPPVLPPAPALPSGSAAAPTPVVVPAPAVADPDESPATAPPKPPPKPEPPKTDPPKTDPPKEEPSKEEPPKEDKKPSVSEPLKSNGKEPAKPATSNGEPSKDPDPKAGSSQDSDDLLLDHDEPAAEADTKK